MTAGIMALCLLTALCQPLRGEAPMASKTHRVVRNARCAGSWYPQDPNELRSLVRGCLGDARPLPAITNRIVAAIAPHAGLIYSGRVAGFTFRALREQAANSNQAPETVVVLGFPHRYPLDGVALLDGDAISTPLGETPLDVEGARIMIDAGKTLSFDADPHLHEHSAENEVPFVQAALPKARLILALMGGHDAGTVADLAKALGTLASRRRIVLVASTDLLHHADYDRVTRTDRHTLALITGLDDTRLRETWSPNEQICCGIGPVLTAIQFARSQGCREGLLLHYRNSGDDFPEGRGTWVVGYGSVVFPGATP